jgi:hypothetical protein
MVIQVWRFLRTPVESSHEFRITDAGDARRMEAKLPNSMEDKVNE